MPAVFHHAHIVRSDEIDPQGHASNLAFLDWLQTASVAHSAEQGWPLQRYVELGSGWVVRSHTIEYLQPAFLGDTLDIVTWVADFRKATSRRKFRVVRLADEALLAVAETNWAFVDLARRVPRRVPPELVQAFHVVGSDNEPELPTGG